MTNCLLGRLLYSNNCDVNEGFQKLVETNSYALQRFYKCSAEIEIKDLLKLVLRSSEYKKANKSIPKYRSSTNSTAFCSFNDIKLVEKYFFEQAASCGKHHSVISETMDLMQV